MAFALAKVRAYGVEAEEALNKRYRQFYILDITAANTDTDLDLSDNSGTFWSAVDGSEPGDTALATLKDIVTRSDALIAVKSEPLLSKVQVGTVSGAGEYSVAVTGKRPDVAFNSGDAPTSYIVVLEYLLKDGEYPVEVYEAA